MILMLTELDILKDVTGKFDKLGIQYMLTGSLAMSYYVQPRMTRDIDLVVEINSGMIGKIEQMFETEYYLFVDSIKDAIENEFMFNLIHNKSSIKVDCIVRKNEKYRLVEFERRNKIKISDFHIFIVSKEDLIISKLLWIKEGDSKVQKADVKNLLNSGLNEEYLLHWIERLDLDKIYQIIKDE
ncbi:MAG: hypothetical protein KJ771_02025 [Nanoarchaeota archaeon]|nr:hypothetical protein [Nanoarchaeota archaeon]